MSVNKSTVCCYLYLLYCILLHIVSGAPIEPVLHCHFLLQLRHGGWGGGDQPMRHQAPLGDEGTPWPSDSHRI
jgi:hypothetical protein